MARRTKMDKCIDLLEEIVNDQYFHPALMANIITTTFPPATQERLVTLMKYIYTYHKREKELDQLTGTGQARIPDPIESSYPWIHNSKASAQK